MMRAALRLAVVVLAVAATARGFAVRGGRQQRAAGYYGYIRARDAVSLRLYEISET